MRKIFNNRDFWKDALLLAGATLLIYLGYIIIRYWPNIVEGFNRGWNGQ